MKTINDLNLFNLTMNDYSENFFSQETLENALTPTFKKDCLELMEKIFSKIGAGDFLEISYPYRLSKNSKTEIRIKAKGEAGSFTLIIIIAGFTRLDGINFNNKQSYLSLLDMTDAHLFCELLKHKSLQAGGVNEI